MPQRGGDAVAERAVLVGNDTIFSSPGRPEQPRAVEARIHHAPPHGTACTRLSAPLAATTATGDDGGRRCASSSADTRGRRRSRRCARRRSWRARLGVTPSASSVDLPRRWRAAAGGAGARSDVFHASRIERTKAHATGATRGGGRKWRHRVLTAATISEGPPSTRACPASSRRSAQTPSVLEPRRRSTGR